MSLREFMYRIATDLMPPGETRILSVRPHSGLQFKPSQIRAVLPTKNETSFSLLHFFINEREQLTVPIPIEMLIYLHYFETGEAGSEIRIEVENTGKKRGKIGFAMLVAEQTDDEASHE